jgi:phenylalanyl-tRNA synthetase beta chain
MIGLEVEDIDNPIQKYKDFTVCEVKKVKKHPNADNLNLCELNTINGNCEVVCGADNVRAGMKAVFAPEGSFIPGIGIKLQATKIRGVKSSGMLLSERELSLSDQHDGILELDNNTKIGESLINHIKKNDPIVEVAITPNRSDALGVRGIARDLSAAGVGNLRLLENNKVNGNYEIEKEITLDKDLKEDIYASFILIKNVKNTESPLWLKDRLEAVGLRSINALVDVTNYLTFDLNRPLHVFDYDKIEKGLNIRKAIKGEKIIALDDKQYLLDQSVTVICDENGPESIAGIIGGQRTGCSSETKNVLIESAIWDKINIANTGRKLGIISDARYRNERGIDKGFIDQGLNKAVEMIHKICGGDISHIKSIGSPPKPFETIDFDLGEIERLLGITYSKKEILSILSSLGFQIVDEGKSINITIPSWRHDISEQACIVEEITRIKGTDQIISTPLNKSTGVASRKLSSAFKNRSSAKRILASRGLVETVSYSFISDKFAKLFNHMNESLILLNPISSELNIMRQSLLPNLISSIKKNNDRGYKDISLFEVSHCFKGLEIQDQFDSAAGVRIGKAIGQGGSEDWRGRGRDIDIYDAKEDVLSILRAFGIKDDNYKITQDTPDYYHPGKSGVIRQGPQNILAYFGELHPKISKGFDIEDSLFCFEVFMSNLPNNKKKKTKGRDGYRPSHFMPISRDFAFIFDKDINADDILQTIKRIKNTMIDNVKVFDVYTGKNVPEDKKSVGISITIQPYEKTLKDTEIENISNMIISEITNKFDAQIRA